jgi:hypothetical protein
MNFRSLMLKKPMHFNELEFRRMAEQFDTIFKKVLLTTLLLPQTTKLYKKPQPKNEDQFDLLVVLPRTTKQQLPISSTTIL